MDGLRCVAVKCGFRQNSKRLIYSAPIFCIIFLSPDIFPPKCTSSENAACCDGRRNVVRQSAEHTELPFLELRNEIRQTGCKDYLRPQASVEVEGLPLKSAEKVSHAWHSRRNGVTLHRNWFAPQGVIKREWGESPQLSRSCKSSVAEMANTTSLRFFGKTFATSTTKSEDLPFAALPRLWG